MFLTVQAIIYYNHITMIVQYNITAHAINQNKSIKTSNYLSQNNYNNVHNILQ